MARCWASRMISSSWKMPATPSDCRGQPLFGQAMIAHEGPEIVTARRGFRRHGIKHIAADALRAIAPRRAGAGRRHPDIDVDRAGRFEMNDLPAIDQSRLLQLSGPERRCFDASHPAGYGDVGVAMRDLERRLRHGFIADAAAMDE